MRAKEENGLSLQIHHVVPEVRFFAVDCHTRLQRAVGRGMLRQERRQERMMLICKSNDQVGRGQQTIQCTRASRILVHTEEQHVCFFCFGIASKFGNAGRRDSSRPREFSTPGACTWLAEKTCLLEIPMTLVSSISDSDLDGVLPAVPPPLAEKQATTSPFPWHV